MEVHDGEQVPGDLVKVMRYFIKGMRGQVQGPPEGTEQITTLLREGRIKRSRFRPCVQLLLGGVRRTRTLSDTPIAQNPCRRFPSVVDSLTESVRDMRLSSPDDFRRGRRTGGGMVSTALARTWTTQKRGIMMGHGIRSTLLARRGHLDDI